MKTPLILASSKDSSKNWILPAKVGFWETRYVYRPGKHIIYVSSQSGCVQACRMCHLTATGQTSLVDAKIDDIVNQVTIVSEHIKSLPKDSNDRLHINFMARGEFFSNDSLVTGWWDLQEKIDSIVEPLRLRPTEYLISTILPENVNKDVIDQFIPELWEEAPKLYYSAYSANDKFRKRWLPKSHSFEKALELLQWWHLHVDEDIRFHFCFIDGENDSVDDIIDMCSKIRKARMLVDINIVRYNPPKGHSSRESINLDDRVALLRAELPMSKIKIIPRVGEDVYASCGTFYEGKNV